MNAKNRKPLNYPYGNRFFTDVKSAIRAADIHDKAVSQIGGERTPNNYDQYLLNLWTLQQKGRYQKP